MQTIESSTEKLAERFIQLWRSCSDNTSDGKEVWEALFTHYSEPHRFYHNLGHLQQCLREMDEANSHIKEPEATELAIWFHDIIYRYGARNNEELSARTFRDAARGCMRSDLVKRVSELIIATKHTGEAEDEATAYLVDIDLSGFGLPWEGYLADSNALRQEAPKVSDHQYYQGKLRFLSELTSWDRIFQTDYFNQQLESRARENIARYVGQIKEQGLDQAPGDCA